MSQRLLTVDGLTLERGGRLLLLNFDLQVSAGELIQEYALAIEQGIPAVDVGHAIHAYPTLANGPQLAAAKAFDTKLQSRWLRALLGGYLRFSRLRDR